MAIEARRARDAGRPGAARGRSRVDALTVPLRTPSTLVAIAVGVALEAALAAVTTRFDPIHVYGMPGAVGILVVVAAAIAGGALVGAVVAACGGIVFALVAASQLPTPLLWHGAPLVVTWVVIGLAVGVAADRYRAYIAMSTAEHTRAQREVLRLHQQLVEGLVPQTVAVRDPALDVVVRYRPGQREVELGGDFLDVVGSDDGGVCLLVGDVAGHGPAEAALGAQLRAAWRALAAIGTSPARTLDTLERLIALDGSGSVFATALAATLSEDRLTLQVASGGHPLPILIRADGPPARVAVPVEPALGVAPDGATRRDGGVGLPAEYALLVFTDGLFEGRSAPDSDERLGEPGLLDLLVGARARSFDERQLDALLQDVRRRNGGPLSDDVAVLLLRKRR